MAVNRCTFSNDLKAKDLCYSDEFFKLKSEKVIPSDSFSFDSYEALKNIVDFKTNNYSNLFLINKQETSNWLESKVKKKERIMSLATTMSWFASVLEDDDEQGQWLYFNKTYEIFDTNMETIDCLMTYGKSDFNNSNYIFYINFISENECTICHSFGDLMYYLVCDENKTLKFAKSPIDNSEKFVYLINDNKLRLFKRILHKKYDERDEVVGYFERFYTIHCKRNENKEAELIVVEGQESESVNNICYVTNNVLDFNFFVNSSWIGYDRSKFISSVNPDKSAFNLETQALIHHQYNKDNGFNFIPLKNNLSYKGNTIRGNYMNDSNLEYPDVDFRTYTSIQSGLNQEKGNDTIILTFNFTDQEYTLNDGDDLIFTIPEKSLEETNMVEPLWPYKTININDTKFIKNGAFGSSVPFFSDKIKKLQNHKSGLKDYLGNDISVNNGVYLCSWLYKPTHESNPIWLDRYYYPDQVSRKDALVGEVYEQSFENILDKNYDKDYIKKKIYQHTYFDKKSDMVIEPGNTYRYQRLSKKMVDELIDNISPYQIEKYSDTAKREYNTRDLFNFDNEHYRIVKYDKWNKTNIINFNTDIYLRSDKKIGLQIFGTDYTDGFNIQNRKDLVPYHYYATDYVIYLCNNKFEIVHQFDMRDKYNDRILKLFLGDVFDDVVVVTGIWLYIFSYDLRLKSRIDLTATSGEDNAIMNLDLNLANGLERIIDLDYGSGGVFNTHPFIGNDVTGMYTKVDTDGNITYEAPSVSLINYPYNHNKIKIGELKNKISGKIEIKGNDKTNTISFGERLIGIYSNRFLSKTPKNKGKVFIPSKLCQMICKYNSILYKNNLYIPINQNVLKIVMCPDTNLDFELFGDEERENYPAVARLLNVDEVYYNYTKTDDAEFSSDITSIQGDNVGIEQNFIEVENRVKHIFIKEDGKVYALNYDQFGISADGDTIYGLYASDRYVASGGWWWLFNQSLSKMHSDSGSSKYAEFASPNSIDRVKLNNRGEMCLIRNFHNLADNENEDNNKRMDIYDKTKQIVYTYDLSAFDKVLSLDCYTFIDEKMDEHPCFTALCKSNDTIFQVTYLCDNNSMIVRNTNLPSDVCENFVETVNSNANLRYQGQNCLYFNLHVPSHYTYDHVATIKWDISDIQDGWYNINAYINLDEAVFQVRINDIIYETINEDTHSWFKPFVSSDGTTFNSTYYLGCLGKKYGTTLNKILKNGFYDPYACRDSKVENLTIYTKKIDYHEYQAIRLKNRKINQLILTLPCGNRNNIDEMVRYFKYNSSPAISNKVKINIAGTGLQTEGEFELLRKEIMAVLENNKDCLVDVKEITFV